MTANEDTKQISPGDREIAMKGFRDSVFFDPYKKIAHRGEYAWWILRGKPRPKVPHLVKQRAVAEFANRFQLPVLVETGSNLGHMLNAQKDNFREIYSIELDLWLAARAKRKFQAYPHIHLYQGDSGVVLPKIVPTLRERCLFWLDAHWGDQSAPIKQELECIYRHPVRDHVLLVDDARWFDGRGDYLSIADLRDHAAKEYPGSVVEVKDDIIRIYNPHAKTI